jgi:BMFP domain-containing protein YqiC
MTQTSNRFFDEIGRLMNDAAGAAQGVKREEFEAVKDMARLAREENEALKARIAVLERPSSAVRRPEEASWPGLSRPSTSFPRTRVQNKTWMPGTSPRMTNGERGLPCDQRQKNPRISLSFRPFGARTPPRPQPPHPWRLAAALTGPRCGL